MSRIMLSASVLSFRQESLILQERNRVSERSKNMNVFPSKLSERSCFCVIRVAGYVSGYVLVLGSGTFPLFACHDYDKETLANPKTYRRKSQDVCLARFR